MKEFIAHINSQGIEELRQELQELYSGLESVRNYYQIKLNKFESAESLLSKYREQIRRAIYPNDRMQGGLDITKVDGIVKALNTGTTIKYYIEVCLYAIEECTNIADELGGSFGEDFYIYFEELFDKIVGVVVKENLETEYKMRLKEIADSAFEGYGHYDQLQDTLSEYIRA